LRTPGGVLEGLEMLTVLISSSLIWLTGQTWVGAVAFAVGVLIDAVNHRSME
jgi:hypothetical protein